MIWEDPIVWFLRKQSWVLTHAKKINKEIKLIDPNKTLFGFWCDGAPVDKFFNEDYSNKLIITNSIVDCSFEQSRHIHTVNSTWYGMYYYNYPDISVPIQKDYNCFVNRFDPFRQSWIYQLIRRKLFNRGYISFNAEVHKPPLLPPVEVFELGFQKFNSIFASEHEIIKDQIPYKNFNDNGDLTNHVLASKFSIILETCYHDNKIHTYSEKTFRCLQLPRPWILCSSPGSVEQLRKFGFDVLDDIVDHGYDLIAEPIQRQVAMLDLCQQLVELDIPSIATRCQHAANHNKSLLKSMNDAWLINIMEDFNQAKQKVLSL